MIRISHASPAAQVSIALALMTCLLVLLAHELLGAFTGGEPERARGRRVTAEALAVHGASLIQRGDFETLSAVLRSASARDPQIGSIAFRRVNGQVVAQTGEPGRWWRPEPHPGTPSSDQLRISLRAGADHWGNLEIAYRRSDDSWLSQWLDEPLVPLIVFVFFVGLTGFWLFMRRVLQHLDPASVIPDRVRDAFDVLVEGIVITDMNGRLVMSNQAFRQLLPGTELKQGSALSSLNWVEDAQGSDRDQDSPDARHPWLRAMLDIRVLTGETMNLQTASGLRKLVVTASPVRDDKGSVRGCMVSFADVTEVSRANDQLRRTLEDLQASRVELEIKGQELERLATRDSLTDCLNRRAFSEQGRRMFERARFGRQALAAVMIDIDHFKSVNDRFGHAVGDRVIRLLGKTLSDCVRGDALVARYGGEEFAILMPSTTVSQLAQIAERLREEVQSRAQEEFAIGFSGLRVTVSVGVAELEQGVLTLDALLEHADAALYLAKSSGRNRVCFYGVAVQPQQPGGLRT
jgi:diguanylate cyclase (GGDEF)-like protein